MAASVLPVSTAYLIAEAKIWLNSLFPKIRVNANSSREESVSVMAETEEGDVVLIPEDMRFAEAGVLEEKKVFR